MTLFDFWARTPEWDREADHLRFQRLLETLADVAVQIEHESDGLQARYIRASDGAPISFEVMEIDGQPAVSSKLSEAADCMARCLARIAALQGQVAFVEMLRQSVISYAEDMAFDGVVPECAASRLRH